MAFPKQILTKLRRLWNTDDTVITEGIPVLAVDIDGEPVDGVRFDEVGSYTGTAIAPNYALPGTVRPTLGAANLAFATGAKGGNLAGGETVTLTLYRKGYSGTSVVDVTVGTITATTPAVLNGAFGFVVFADTSNLIKNSTHYKVTGTLVVGNGTTGTVNVLRTKLEGDMDAVVDQLVIANTNLGNIYTRQANGAQKTQLVNAAGTSATLTGTALDVNIASGGDPSVSSYLLDMLIKQNLSGADVYNAVGTRTGGTTFTFTPPAPVAASVPTPIDVRAIFCRSTVAGTIGLWYEVPMETLTISGAPAPFTVTVTGATFPATCEIKIFFRGVTRGFDTAGNGYATAESQPLSQKYSGPTSLGAAVALVTTTWTDLGPEIDVRGYNKIRFYLTVDKNDSTGIAFRVMLKDASAAADEYIYKFGTVAAGVVTLDNSSWTLGDADGYIEVSIPDLGNTVAFVQGQIYCGAQGASQGTVAGKYIMAY